MAHLPGATAIATFGAQEDRHKEKQEQEEKEEESEVENIHGFVLLNRLGDQSGILRE